MKIMDKSLISLLAGLGGMFGWGTADFFAGEAVQKAGNLKTFFWVQVFGLAANLVFLAFNWPSSLNITPNLIVLILSACLAYFFGYQIFYKAFSVGELSIVSPIVTSYAVFSVLVSFFVFHQPLKAIQLLSIATVIVGVVLVSVDFSKVKHRLSLTLTPGVKEALTAAVFFGLVFWPLNEYVSERFDWILFNVIIKVAAILMFILLSPFFYKTVKVLEISKGIWRLLILAGFLDLFGFLSVTFGISRADAILVIPISSAFSVVTVILAKIFLKEKTTFTQGCGIALTIFGIILTGI